MYCAHIISPLIMQSALALLSLCFLQGLSNLNANHISVHAVTGKICSCGLMISSESSLKSDEIGHQLLHNTHNDIGIDENNNIRDIKRVFIEP